MNPLKIGLVGIGAQTQENILPSLLHTPDIQIVAGCDSDPQRIDYLRRYVPGAKGYLSVEDMLGKIDLDVVVVACPPQAHRDIARLAMKHGVNVFVEKPPCLNIEELHELVAIADGMGVATGVGMNFRFARPIQHLRAIREEPDFGNIAHVQINHYANKPRTPLWSMDSTLRSFLLAQAIHSIDLAVVFGGRIRELRSEVQNRNGPLIAEINIGFESGATASILTGTMFPYFEFDMKIVSDKSSMVQLDNLWNITLHEPGHLTRTGGADKRWRGSWQPGPLDSGYVRSGYQVELERFFHAVRTGTGFEADFNSLLPTYEVIESVCETAERHVAPAEALRAADTAEALTFSNVG